MSDSVRLGDVAEFLFDAQAVKRKLIVNRPIHAGTVYDRVVEKGGRFYKVQIKSCNVSSPSGNYRVHLRRSNSSGYKKSMVDVFAVYIQETNTWYLFRNTGVNSVRISTRYKDSTENWSIFNEKI